MKLESFPYETHVEIENQPFFQGRLIISQTVAGYNTEIDVVNRESQKIYKHVDILYNQGTSQEALENGMFRLGQFLRNPDSK